MRTKFDRQSGYCWQVVRSVIGLVGLGLLAGCSQPVEPVTEPGAAKLAHAAATDVPKARVEYARGFTLEYHPGYRVLQVRSPLGGRRATYTYVLARRGSKKPPIPAGATFVETPVQRLVSTSSTYAPYLTMLHVVPSLVGVAAGALVTTPEVESQIRSGKVAEISNSPFTGVGFNMERLYSLHPELIMLSNGGPSADGEVAKLREAGFALAFDGDYLESTPLGRTEWIKFIGAFFDKDAEAQELFDGIVRRYKAQTEIVRRVKSRPTVFTAMDYQGTWYIPGGKSYVAALLKDAGAQYMWEKDQTVGSIPFNMETVVTRARDADFWLNPGDCICLDDLTRKDNRYEVFRAFREGNVYNSDRLKNSGGGSDYWDGGVANPDRVLSDLIAIFHPDLLPHHSFIWYRKLLPKANAH